MPDKLAIDVVDIRGFNRELKRAGTEFPRELRAANKATAEVIVPEMQRRVPKGESRRLFGSIGVKASTRDAYVKVGSQVRVPYAFPVNFGWPSRGIPAQEFVYSSIEAKDSEIYDKYEDAIDDLVRRAFPEGV